MDWGQHIGLSRKGVTIVPDEAAATLGSASSRQCVGGDIEWDKTGKNILRVMRMVQSLLAGEIAQRRYNPRSVRHYHGQSDREKAIALLSYLTPNPEEWDIWLKLCKIRAEQMLLDPNIWRAVERLAGELVQRQTIRGKEATEIIREGFNESLYSKCPEMRSRDLAFAARQKAQALKSKPSPKDSKREVREASHLDADSDSSKAYRQLKN
jgi:hypothetical protein